MADEVENFKKTLEAAKTDVVDAAAAAKKSGKPLLVIISEDQDTPQGIVLDMAILKAAHSQGIKHHVEQADDISVAITQFKEIEQRKRTTDFTVPMSKLIGMKTTGIDKPNPNLKPEDRLADLQRREAHMTKELLALKEGAVFITTKRYTQAFSADAEIQKKFHVLTINTSDSATQKNPATPFEKLLAQRNDYANDPKNAKQYNIPESILDKMGFGDMVIEVIGDKYYDRYVDAIKPPPIIRARNEEREKPLPTKEFTKKEIEDASAISPKLVEETQKGANFANALDASGTVSLKRLAEAAKLQPAIITFVRSRGAYHAMASKALPIERLEKLTEDQLDKLDYMATNTNALNHEFASKLASLDGGPVPKLSLPAAPPPKSKER